MYFICKIFDMLKYRVDSLYHGSKSVNSMLIWKQLLTPQNTLFKIYCQPTTVQDLLTDNYCSGRGLHSARGGGTQVIPGQVHGGCPGYSKQNWLSAICCNPTSPPHPHHPPQRMTSWWEMVKFPAVNPTDCNIVPLIWWGGGGWYSVPYVAGIGNIFLKLIPWIPMDGFGVCINMGLMPGITRVVHKLPSQ